MDAEDIPAALRALKTAEGAFEARPGYQTARRLQVARRNFQAAHGTLTLAYSKEE
jgi:hypothetical protein